jgi:ferredoxin
VAVYHVRLLNTDLGLDQTLAVPEEEYILDIAEALGLRLPAGCRQGNCSVCIAKMIEGTVDQSDQTFLDASEVEAGLVTLCVASPRSDCVLVTHQEQCFGEGLYFTNSSKC